MSTWWRSLLKRFHSEGIPWPKSVLYNAVSGTGIFRRHYELVAEDVARYGQAGSLLDIGTGPGRLLLALRKAFPCGEHTRACTGREICGTALGRVGAPLRAPTAVAILLFLAPDQSISLQVETTAVPFHRNPRRLQRSG